MARLESGHGIRGREDQARRYHARERRLSRRTVVSELFRTHTFAEAGNPIDTGLFFPSRDENVTIQLRMEITGPAPSGVLFELGSSTTGIGIVCNGNIIAAAAGDGDDDGTFIAVSDGLPDLTVGRVYDIVYSVRPGTGESRLWVNGRLLGRNTAVNGALTNGWADLEGGAVNDTEGTLNSDLALVAGPKQDGRVAGDVSVYHKQLPRHFDDSIYA